MAGKGDLQPALHCRAVESNERELFISHPLSPGQYRPCINLQGFPSLNLNSSRFPALPLGYCSLWSCSALCSFPGSQPKYFISPPFVLIRASKVMRTLFTNYLKLRFAHGIPSSRNTFAGSTCAMLSV